MTDLIWIKKTTNRNLSNPDVSITINKNGKNRDQHCLRFRNNCFLRFSKNDFVEFAATGTRIYFRESNPKDGYKLTSHSNGCCGFKTIYNLSKFLGDYELLWDSETKLNYIDLSKKIAYKEAN